jgi:hypothetical protein
MPEDLSSHGARRGIIEEAAAEGATLPAIANFSGHAPEDEGLAQGSTISSYLSNSPRKAAVVAAFTAGWPLAQGSVLKHMPLPASLSALADEPQFGFFSDIADSMFSIFPAVTPWLAVGGRLRFYVEQWLAAQIMYYERRRNRYGAAFIPVAKLVAALKGVLKVSTSDADAMICAWGVKVHDLFISSNQRILIDKSLVATLQGLSGTVADLQGTVTSLATSLASVVAQQGQLMQLMLQQGGGGGIKWETVAPSFTATSAAAEAAASDAAAATARLRAVGTRLVLPASIFPHDEPRRARTGAPAAGAPLQLPPPPPSAPPAARAQQQHQQLAAMGAPPPLPAAKSAAAAPPPPAARAQPPPPAAYAPPPPPAAQAQQPPLPPASGAQPSVGGAPPALFSIFTGAPPKVRVDSEACLSTNYAALLQGKLVTVSKDGGLYHRVDKKQREALTFDAKNPTVPASKAKMIKISNGLDALHALATPADKAVLLAGLGSTLMPQRTAVQAVCSRLVELLRRRLLFEQCLREKKQCEQWEGLLTSNTFEGRAGAAVASFLVPPSEHFLAALVLDGPQYKEYVAEMRLAAATHCGSGGSSGGKRARRDAGGSEAGSESESAGGDSGGEGGAATRGLSLGGHVLGLDEHKARVRERDAASSTRRAGAGPAAVFPSAIDRVVGAARSLLRMD